MGPLAAGVVLWMVPSVLLVEGLTGGPSVIVEVAIRVGLAFRRNPQVPPPGISLKLQRLQQRHPILRQRPLHIQISRPISTITRNMLNNFRNSSNSMPLLGLPGNSNSLREIRMCEETEESSVIV